jgi:hypothetical protein
LRCVWRITSRNASKPMSLFEPTGSYFIFGKHNCIAV